MSEVTLIKTNSDTALLAVPQSLLFIASSFEFMSRVYHTAIKLYPTITSIIIVTGTEYELIESGDIVLHNVEPNRI